MKTLFEGQSPSEVRRQANRWAWIKADHPSTQSGINTQLIDGSALARNRIKSRSVI